MASITGCIPVLCSLLLAVFSWFRYILTSNQHWRVIAPLRGSSILYIFCLKPPNHMKQRLYNFEINHRYRPFQKGSTKKRGASPTLGLVLLHKIGVPCIERVWKKTPCRAGISWHICTAVAAAGLLKKGSWFSPYLIHIFNVFG